MVMLIDSYAAHNIQNHRVDLIIYCDDEVPSCIRKPRRWSNASDGTAAGSSESYEGCRRQIPTPRKAKGHRFLSAHWEKDPIKISSAAAKPTMY
jgi:4,5-DOPA dioxygenase extradiol